MLTSRDVSVENFLAICNFRVLVKTDILSEEVVTLATKTVVAVLRSSTTLSVHVVLVDNFVAGKEMLILVQIVEMHVFVENSTANTGGIIVQVIGDR